MSKGNFVLLTTLVGERQSFISIPKDAIYYVEESTQNGPGHSWVTMYDGEGKLLRFHCVETVMDIYKDLNDLI